MVKELNCEQVMALMTFYGEDILSRRLREDVENHLDKCKKCRDAYAKAGYVVSHKECNFSLQPVKYDKQIENMYKNLSAYMDNELNEKESMRVKKVVISNPMVREKFKEMYNTKLLLHNSFEKIRNECKKDYASSVMEKLSDTTLNRHFDLYRALGFFSATLTMIVVVLLAILYS